MIEDIQNDRVKMEGKSLAEVLSVFRFNFFIEVRKRLGSGNIEEDLEFSEAIEGLISKTCYEKLFKSVSMETWDGFLEHKIGILSLLDLEHFEISPESVLMPTLEKATDCIPSSF